MAQYAIFTTFTSVPSKAELAGRSEKVRKALMAQVPSMTGKWVCDYGFEDGAVNAIDIVEANNADDVQTAARIISEQGQCQTKVARAQRWHEYAQTGVDRKEVGCD
ncbi:MAG TPA: hypothetical protein VHU83_11750 [Bryobacteraceae bacterium]|nr:hypothetical protein [Bryobacteraceae bacterium]